VLALRKHRRVGGAPELVSPGASPLAGSRSLRNGGTNEPVDVFLISVWLAMDIHGGGACPTADDVERKLAPLLAPGFEAHTADVVTVEEGADGTVTILLDGADGGAIAHRLLPRAPSCAEQAERVAVALATWEAQLHPEIALRLGQLAPATEAPPVPAPAPAAVVRALLPPAASTRVASLGVATLVDWQAGWLTSGARIDLTLGPAARSWRARMGFVGVGSHAETVAPGEGRWWRAYLTMGADVSLALGERWAAVLGVAAAGGVVNISGSGYQNDRTARSVDLGAELASRLEWRRGQLRPWLGVALAGWARRQDLVVGSQVMSTLPRAEPSLALGVDFVR
jgi:hypothetical protein